MEKAAATKISMKGHNNGGSNCGVDNVVKFKTEAEGEKKKPHFVPAPDDTKPILEDPILRSDPIETEEAVLRLPPFPVKKMESGA